MTLDRDLVSGVLDRPDPEPDLPERPSSSAAGSSPSRRAKQARIASGEQAFHEVAAIFFGEDREVECSCGKTVAGRTDEAMARAFRAHWAENRRDRSGPAEIVRAGAAGGGEEEG